MKIVTINVPESYIDAINKLIGQGGLYPSRSELIRVAVREFLLRELKLANTMAKYKETEPEDDFDDENFVRVPIEKTNEKSEPIREFKAYKILKRLNYNSTEDSPKETNHGEFTGKVNYDKSYDDVSEPSNYTPPSSERLRKQNPDEPYFKFINER